MLINICKPLIQEILDKEFTNSKKRHLICYDNRIQFACPYCQDSAKDMYAKRGNLYLSSLLYICFNCGKTTSFDKFCKDFHISIDPDKKLELIKHLNENISYNDYKNSIYETDLDDLINLDDLVDVFNNKNISPISDFTPIKKNSGIYKYLIKRGIPPELHRNIWMAKYWKNDEQFDHIICLLNRGNSDSKSNKILGLQIRNLKDGKNRYFKIFNYESLLKLVKGEDYELDMNKVTLYNKLSYYFNILNVDLTKKVTLFEGYLDSLFYPNSIGMVGTNTDTKFMEQNDIDINYFYDNDNSGNMKSLEKLKNGYNVFLWNKLFENIVKNKPSSDPYKLMYRIKKVKDLNKLSQITNNPNVYLDLSLKDFFSKDIYDIKWIDKSIGMNRTNKGV